MLAALHVHGVHPRDAVVAVVAGASRRRVALAELCDERRVVDERPGHLNQLESRVQHPVDALAADKPPDVDQRTFQGGPEFLGVFEEIALLEGELFIIKGPHQRMK